MFEHEFYADPTVFALWQSSTGSGHSLLLVQHQLDDAPAQIQAFLKLGIDSADVYWIDIPYTSFASIRTQVRELGVPEENFLVTDLMPLTGYGSWQVERVRN